jgi:hypothetical protein
MKIVAIGHAYCNKISTVAMWLVEIGQFSIGSNPPVKLTSYTYMTSVVGMRHRYR